MKLQCLDIYEEGGGADSSERGRFVQTAWEGRAEAMMPAAGGSVPSVSAAHRSQRIRGFIEAPPRHGVQAQSLGVVNIPFGQQIVRASADMLPVERGWRLWWRSLHGTDFCAEIDLPIEVAVPGTGAKQR
jgi:hypothetical protein